MSATTRAVQLLIKKDRERQIAGEPLRYDYRERYGEYHVKDMHDRIRTIAICDREDDAIDITDALNELHRNGMRTGSVVGTPKEWLRRDQRAKGR